ncbi:L-lactate MFS transporter [Planococcus plakortidis]|uniref:L-lactate MFS transporter n=1 Tax=Planococcus plakortidis TaxID=1038856 RepID=UPI003984A801
MKTNKNRWLIALSAIAIQLSIGAAYAYSVYTKPISETMGWSPTEITYAFTIMMALGGISAAFFGGFVEKNGPRKSAMVAAFLFGLGQAGAGFATQIDSLVLFLLTYGFMSGMGLGVGYIAPISTLVKWFPDRRGLATGMAVMGFGAGALITAPVAASLIASVGVTTTFYILGISYFILISLGASYIAPPPEGFMPKGMEADLASGKKVMKKDLAQLTAKEAVKTRRFWMLWTMMLINVSAGIMIISVASPMAQELVGLTAAGAATLVGIMGIFNGGGRLGWAAISDYIGRPTVFMLFFIIQIIAFVMLPGITNVIIFQVFILLIVSCYGGGFSNLPAFIGDMFGTRQLGAIHGYLLTTWSLGGIVGPAIVSQVYAATNSYVPVFYIFIGLISVALVLSILIRMDIRRVERNYEKEEKVQSTQQAVSS